nr:hypothetical protein [Tanacetum cinerariifolium]
PNSPQLAREDLEQIDPDDLEEIDLHWEMAMQIIKARRFIKRIGRNLDINGQKIGFDRSKVECFNCSKNGHFVRECRAPKNQENRGREYGQKTMPVENLTKNALIDQDGIGGSDSKVDSCSRTCIKAYATLKEQYDSLSLDYKKSQFNLVSYKAVENTKKLEKEEKERDELKLTLEKFQNSSKSLNNLLENQENVKSISDKGYHAVPPPYTGNYIPPKPDLMFIDEQVESKSVDVVSNVASSDVKTVESKHEFVDVKNKGVYSTRATKHVRKDNFSPPINEDWNSNDESEVEFKPTVEVKTVRPSIEKIKFVKTAREKVEKGNPQQKEYKEKGVIGSGCSRHITGNKCYLSDYEYFDGGFVYGDGKGRIFGKVNTACYVLDRALVIKPHNKTPYELIHGRPPLINFMKPFGCPGNQTNGIVGTKDNIVASQAKKKKQPKQEYILIPICTTDPLISQGPKDSAVDAGKKVTKVDKSRVSKNGRQDDQVTRSEFEGLLQQERQTEHINSTNNFNIVVSPVNTAGQSFVNTALPSHINAAGTPATVEEEVDMNNVDSSYTILDAPLTKFLKDNPKDQVFRNNKDERGMVIKNKAILVAQGNTQEEGIDYDEVIAPIARIEAIRLFLAYASFKNFAVYQMYVKSAFLYGNIEKEKFDFTTVKTTSTLMEPNKALVKDAEAKDVDLHLYRSMIGSLMYLTASRPDITFDVCACTRFEVTPKISYLHVVKRIFRYLKGQPKLGLWYPRDSPFDLEAYSDSDYTGASLDRKSTIEGYQFLRKRLISWQCKKQTIVENSTTEAEYVTVAYTYYCKMKVNPAKHKLTTAGDGFCCWVSPTIYTLYIKQFWTSAKVKTVNDDVRLQALVDGKKVIVNEASIRHGVLSLEQTKTNQAVEIKKLKKRGNKLKGNKKKRTHGLKRLYKVFVDVTTGEDVEQDAIIAKSVEGIAVATTPPISKDKLTLAQTLMEIKASKPKAKGMTIQEPKPKKPLKKKDQIALDEEVARKLEAEMKAEMDEEERITREKNDANREQAKVADDDIIELKRCLEIVPEHDDDVVIKATSLSSKSPTIIDYKTYREGKKSYIKIIRTGGNSQNYLTFGTMFKNFNKEELEVLRSIVKERFKKTKPVDDMDNLLFQTLKTMFEPHVEDIIWKYQQGAVKVNNWKLLTHVECIVLQQRI